MHGGGAPRVERRGSLRASVRLPIQVRDPGAVSRLEAGVTLDIGSGGVLAEFPGAVHLDFPSLVDVHVGLPPGLWPEVDGRFTGRIKRWLERPTPRCAIEAAGSPPPYLLVPELIGKHRSIIDVKRQLARIAACDANVLIRGESGTGKSFVAKLIHRYSSRAEARLLRQNCPSIPETLLESQLFGHVKGAFTDAKTARPGMFRLAHQGSIVLDEISVLPCSVQAKLLQGIEEKRFFPVGGNREVQVDVRIIATTNDDLEQMMRAGGFRADLYYRLNELCLTLPPLRDRKSDIPLLADYFLRKNAAALDKPYEAFTGPELEMLVGFSWPGNVRQLENTIKRRLLLGRLELAEEHAQAQHPPLKRHGGSLVPDIAHGGLRSVLAATERRAIFEALECMGHNRTRAASLLGVSYRTLLRKIKEHHIEV